MLVANGRLGLAGAAGADALMTSPPSCSSWRVEGPSQHPLASTQNAVIASDFPASHDRRADAATGLNLTSVPPGRQCRPCALAWNALHKGQRSGESMSAGTE